MKISASKISKNWLVYVIDPYKVNSYTLSSSENYAIIYSLGKYTIGKDSSTQDFHYCSFMKICSQVQDIVVVKLNMEYNNENHGR